jgi:membrane-associated HD superfamily phosphohydrolase
MRGFRPSNSLPSLATSTKRELLLIVVVLVLIIIALTTSIVFFLFIINQDLRSKVLTRVRNGRWRIKSSHLMHRRVRKIESSCCVLLIPFLPMELLSHALTVGLTLSSTFAEHVEASKETFGNEIQLALLAPTSPMRVRGTLHWKGIIRAPWWWFL